MAASELLHFGSYGPHVNLQSEMEESSYGRVHFLKVMHAKIGTGLTKTYKGADF